MVETKTKIPTEEEIKAEVNRKLIEAQEEENLRILMDAGKYGPPPTNREDLTIPQFAGADSIDMQRIPVTAKVDMSTPLKPVKGVKHYLHIIEVEMPEGHSEYRALVSPLSKDNTLRFIRNRLVVTKFGLDLKPCDYMDVKYLCNFFFDMAGKEIGVWHLIHSSSLAEIGTYAPEIMKQLNEEELARLIDSATLKRLIDLTAENASLREQVRSFGIQLDQFFKGKYNIGGKLFEHIMNLSALLPESDRSKLIDNNGNIFTRLMNWLEKNPTAKMIISVVSIVALIIGVLILSGIVKIN
jgi:hypothetical protein